MGRTFVRLPLAQDASRFPVMQQHQHLSHEGDFIVITCIYVYTWNPFDT